MSTSIEKLHNQKILFSPLNWGWGHCTRSIALLQRLQSQGNEIWVATNPRFQTVYSSYLNGVHYLSLEDYPFKFDRKGNFVLDILKQAGGMFAVFKLEGSKVDEWVEELGINVVISDHRLGFRASRQVSILVCHQLNLKHRWMKRLLNNVHRGFLNIFDAVWLPDDEDRQLSGELSMAQLKVPVNFIGRLSRFKSDELVAKSDDHVLIVSGPEPHASFLYQEVVAEYVKKQKQLKVVYTLIDAKIKIDSHLVNHLDNLTWVEIDQVLSRAQLVISRSGYSTIMDLQELGCDYRLIPTPGQGEQLYLATRHKKKPSVN